MTERLVDHKIVSEKEWSRLAKHFSRRKRSSLRCEINLASNDAICLGWPVNKEYVFDGQNGKQTLSELFDGRSQLIVYHFMFDPAGKQDVCIVPFRQTISMK